MSHVYLSVALDVPLPRCFDYRAPRAAAGVGERVIVPFGRQTLSGVVVAVSDRQPDFPGLKDIGSAPGDLPALPGDVLALCRFCADFYAAPLGMVLAAALPAALRQPKPWSGDEARLSWLAVDADALLTRLSPRAKKQRQLADSLRTPQSREAIRDVAGDALRWLAEWQASGEVIAVAPARPEGMPQQGSLPALHASQAHAVEAINAAAGFAAFLLYGVTGSGKTEVYLRTIAERLGRGEQVLVLVPEINLTPQLEARFRARFPQEAIVSLHSGLADGERTRNWLRAVRGEARIVLGTRLSVFTPLPSLGLIVVDEEHDGSYRQQEGVRYSARDLAVWRARDRVVPVVLGSATPSIETWKNAREGRYTRLDLPHRAVGGAVAPTLEVLPTGKVFMPDGIHPLALERMRATLARGGQALVFINRRGYSPVLTCNECGWVSNCKRCEAKLVLHLNDRRLRCHHCGFECVIPVHCPDCGNADLKPLGQGTQRIEDVLATHFPATPPLRIDRDNTRRKGSLEAMLATVHSGETRLLVGTQMLAKGHDFANLQLVVVLNADAGLFSVDFRAEERLFAQLLQVAGRAGRAGQPGQVLIQTRYPEHPFYAALLAGDYAAFADEQLAARRDLLLPPCAAWLMVRAEAKRTETAIAFLNALRGALAGQPVQAMTPIAASMSRKAGWERAQMLVTAATRGPIAAAAAHLSEQLAAKPPKGVRWVIDVDPQEV
ncbi:primosomal protein N' [Jeongeupia sp. HS-3]|uniref:primosomal protein N' n=1 Tax=Jeongeupia sp. HS-3 TaxID=1009682 RepID=UPI0018A394BD|nr:primosomal protein N' [Jeongeupia sp. HS-3]BCL75721.1 primosomal protein N' [Jeongeupia sp. HS-3]